MKLKYEMTTMDIDGNVVAIPADEAEDFHGIIRMNETSAVVLELLKEDTDVDKIVSAILDEYDTDEATARASVDRVIEALRKEDLIYD